LFDTEIKKLKPQDKDFIKKFLLQDQIMREVDTGLDVKNFRNINKDSITKWMNKNKKFKKNTVLKDQALKILEDNPQITKSQGVLGTKDSQPQIKNILKDFEKHGCGLAAGGRILFSNGTPGGKPTKCAQKGIARFVDDLKKRKLF
jgi:lipoate synthase